MTRTTKRIMLAAACFAALLITSGEKTSAADCGYSVPQLNLFYNYYVGPGYNGVGTPAQLYLSPRPTPPLVGHTYVTYQPFMPHEYLYKHHRLYVRVHPDGSGTRTKVSWY